MFCINDIFSMGEVDKILFQTKYLPSKHLEINHKYQISILAFVISYGKLIGKVSQNVLSN